MRQACIAMVHELARQDPRVVFIGSDIGAGTLAKFREEMPDRFFMEGVSEASVLGMAAGLALEGHVVYVNTLAVFLTRRVYEQAALDICLHNANVRLIGSGGGFVYAPLGPTHMATDDIALMRALPNMTILAPADAREMRRLMPLTLDHEGPIYIRLGKGGDPVVTPEEGPCAIGRAVVMREGADGLIVTTGVMLQLALEAAEALASQGREVAILHCPTVKPLDVDALRAAIDRVAAVITVEEHIKNGGLGSAVAEIVAETPWASPKRFRALTLPDAFVDHYGSQADLWKIYGLTPERIAGAVTELLSVSF